jgi:hypothetical protein
LHQLLSTMRARCWPTSIIDSSRPAGDPIAQNEVCEISWFWQRFSAGGSQANREWTRAIFCKHTPASPFQSIGHHQSSGSHSGRPRALIVSFCIEFARVRLCAARKERPFHGGVKRLIVVVVVVVVVVASPLLLFGGAGLCVRVNESSTQPTTTVLAKYRFVRLQQSGARRL